MKFPFLANSQDEDKQANDAQAHKATDDTATVITETKASNKEIDAQSATAQKEEPRVPTNLSPMVRIMEQSRSAPEAGDLLEGAVITVDKSALYIDLGPFGTGMIFGREFINARDLVKKIRIGDMITAKVVEPEGEDGYVELSLKEARQALIWNEADDAIKTKTVFELSIKEANKGGLILEWRGIQGFLPASQLKPEHYPRVEDGDKDKILGELQRLVGTTISVGILTADPEEGKLIFSEKSPLQKEKEQFLSDYNVGDVIEGEITGIVDFGAFVKIKENLQGLVHISEMDWGLVENPRTLFHVGQKVSAKIIEVKDGKISLSVKALKENPWIEAKKKYKKGDTVTGVVIKYNKHGALVSIEEGVAGLVHISEFESEKELHDTFELGKSYPFLITYFEPEKQKMTFSRTDVPPKPITAAE